MHREMMPDAPALIYVHIPKTAGSSFRHLVWKNYGRENVFWYGIDQPYSQPIDPDAVGGYKCVGGHFYLPVFGNHFYSSLRTAVLRHPLERAMSLFHYYTVTSPANQRETWLKWGIEPSSMLVSLRRCLPFRRTVSNSQCLALSGKRKLKAVEKEIKSLNILIGIYGDLDWFIGKTAELLNWDHARLESLNVGREGYREKILEEDGLVEEIDRINKEDYALYKWISSIGGLCQIQDKQGLESILNQHGRPEQHYFSKADLSKVRISIQNDFPSVLRPAERVNLPILLTNRSKRTFRPTGSYPVHLGAHWKDKNGTVVVHEGGRCMLPQPVFPGDELQLQFRMKVPSNLASGDYIVTLCLIQKGVRWLDTIDDKHIGRAEFTVKSNS